MPSTKYTPLSTPAKHPAPLNFATCFNILNVSIFVTALTFLSWALVMCYFNDSIPKDSALEWIFEGIPLGILAGIGGAVIVVGIGFGITHLCRMHPQLIPAFVRSDWELDEELGDSEVEAKFERWMRAHAKLAKMVEVWVWIMKLAWDEEHGSEVKTVFAGKSDIERITEKFGDWMNYGSANEKTLIVEKSV